MPQTYDEIQQQIQRLQKKAEAIRSSEVKEVVEKIKVAIAHYDLTADQLGFGLGKRVAGKRAASPAGAKKSGVAETTQAQFSDSEGNVWSGRGRRPAWLRKALEAGHGINEFRIGRRARPKQVTAMPAAVDTTEKAASVAPPASAPPAPQKKKRVAKFQYSDGEGRTWGGLGPKPAWLKTAIAAGKSLSDFAK